MAKTFDYSPDHGMFYEIEDNAQNPGELFIRPIQDVQPVLDFTKAKRNSGLNDRGIKQEWWHYATIPPIVQVAMKDKGIDFHKKSHMPRVLKEINENYPHLKCTDLKHAIKGT